MYIKFVHLSFAFYVKTITFEKTPKNFIHMEKEKKYELLKDLSSPLTDTIPAGRAGTASEWQTIFKASYVTLTEILGNPEWFREVKPTVIAIGKADSVAPRYIFSIAPNFEQIELNGDQRQMVADALNGKLFTKEDLEKFCIYCDTPFSILEAWLKSKTR